MAIQQAQAKFYQAFKLQVSIKSASANLTAGFSAGHVSPATGNILTNVVGTKVLRSINNRFSVNSSVSADGRFAIKGGLIKGNQGLRAVSRLQLRFPTFVKIDIDRFNLPEGANVTLQLEPGFVIEQTAKFPFALGASLTGVELLTFRTPKRVSTQMSASTTLNAEGRVFDNIKLDSQFVLSALGGFVISFDIPNFSAISSSTVSATRKRFMSSNIISESSISCNANKFGPEMVLVYNTSLFNTGNTVTLPLTNIEDSVTVDWGDGTSNTYTIAGNYSKTYTGAQGVRTVSIFGGLTRYGSGATTVTNSNRNLTSVTQFNTATTNFSFAFENATNLTSVPTRLPIGVISMLGMFSGATAFNQNISNWNVSAVTNMRQMFFGATSFNQPIGTWNVSAVIDMDGMFFGATSFNQPIGTWNVSAVTEMDNMFRGATAFNQNISTWNVSAVTDMFAMFLGATSFNNGGNINIRNWNVSNVTGMNVMFSDATSFNQNLSNWTTGLTSQPSGFSTGANETFANNANLLKPFLSSGNRINT